MNSPILSNRPVFIGEDREILFRTTGDEYVDLAGDSPTGATSIPVMPLDWPLASGDKLLFGRNTVVTLSGAHAAGVAFLTITPGLVGPLSSRQRGQRIVNVTGYALEWELLERRGGDPALVTKTTAGGGIVLSTPTEGLVRVLLDDTDTLLLEPGMRYYVLRRTDAGNERPLAQGDLLLEAAGE